MNKDPKPGMNPIALTIATSVLWDSPGQWRHHEGKQWRAPIHFPPRSWRYQKIRRPRPGRRPWSGKLRSAAGMRATRWVHR